MKAFPRMAFPWLLLTLLISWFYGAAYCGEDRDNCDGLLNSGAKSGADVQSDSAPMDCLGQGVPVNYIKAYQFISIASELGYGEAVEALESLTDLMTPEQIAQAQSEAALMREKIQK